VTLDVHEAERASARRPRVWRWVGLGVLAFIGLRLWFNATHWLVPDEAVYWAWSRHLAPGYLDHPPMVAFLIHFSTAIFGSTELGVRMPALVFATGSALVLIWLAHRLDEDWRVTAFMAVAWLGSPLLLTMGTIMTPDTPMYFFSACGLFCAVAAVRAQAKNTNWWWLAFGLFCGLAMLAKYPAVLLPASVGLALLFNREGRVHLRRPWIYFAGVIAVAVFSPVLWWNAQHGWASFKFQLHHGSESADHPGFMGLLEFAGGQLAVWTPVLFVIGIVVLVHFWRKVLRFSISNLRSQISDSNVKSEISDADLKFQISNLKSPEHRSAGAAWLSILLWAGTVPLVFFGIMATRAHGEVNWPAFAYAPISILTALYLAENWQGERVGWARIGCTVALVGAFFMHVPRLLFLMHIRPSPMVQMYQTKPFGQMLDQMQDGRTIVCNRHQDAAVASFYMKGQPDIWAVSFGSRPTAYDYMTGRPDFAAMSRVLFVGYHFEPFCQTYGFDVEREQEVPLPSIRKSKKRTAMLVALDRVSDGSRNAATVGKTP
jgi:4-amino-4-deoxy-L-arabinose transferase-like glycosyltransferase